ncbi:DUF1918 domain-containing protein [Georgenia yuyongxinii]|uniref:DUF1918 domain-containing protein n=1 Tax=Georgenia yuyongxinii TaxID=2589797 RepID=UPI00163DA7BD|nr:DUF1918 domain-containing protein [Georgenia yuyongxinii]
MRAQRGDHIVLAGGRVGETVRDGEILEVRGEGGSPPYLVRWSDGREVLVFPGPDAELRVAHSREEAEAAGAGRSAEARSAPEWQIRVSLFPAGDDTTARVALISDVIGELDAQGASHRGGHDPAVPRIGDEVALARALHHLADQLLARAGHDVETVTGEVDVTIRRD